jgi:DNA polymerase I
MTKKLAIIDGKSVFYRGYYAMSNLALADGTPTGGVYGFASLAIELIKRLEPDYVAVAWDKQGTNIRKRREIFPEYKVGRKKAPDDFYAQIPILYELLEAFGWPLYELDDYEADDLMGTFALEATAKGIDTCLLTSDLDALQLISPSVKVYAMKNGLSNIEEFDVAHFEKKYGIDVEQFLDLKSLKGDSSDNLPGVPGIGEKTGVELLQKYGTLDEIYNHLDDIRPTVAKKLIAGKDLAYMSREVGRIWTDAPVKLDWDVADVNDTDLEKVAAILRRLEFFSLVKRLPRHMQLQSSLEIVDSKEPITLDVQMSELTDSFQAAKSVVAVIDGERIFLSGDSSHACVGEIKQVPVDVWRQLADVKIIGYDIKAIYHQLSASCVDARFSEVHDVRQAAFLLDPLARDRSLAGLFGNPELELSPESSVAALWAVHSQQQKLFEELPRVATVAREIDFPLISVLFDMENRGIKINKQAFSQMSERFGVLYRDIERQMFEMVGYEFNIGSPAQLSEVLFTKLQLPTQGIKKGKTGFSTGQKELDKLRGQHPIIELIETSRELAKLKNTYVDTLPLLADSQDRIHTTFNQDVASTGRLSSTNPNLQNIPIKTELGKEIRYAFVPRDGHVFVGADYSQFELRLAAVLAGDEAMIEDFNQDIDIHAKTASEVYGVPLDQVTYAQRRDAKVINFGVLYGMSPHGLSVATKMTLGEAKVFIDRYFAVRAPIRRYIDAVIASAKKQGYVETLDGRRRPTPDIHSSNFMVRSSAERAAANMPIQGTEADLMKKAMLQVEKRIGSLGEQLLQVHDSILIECESQNSAMVADILRQTMENVAPQLKVKLKVDVKIGNSWGDL